MAFHCPPKNVNKITKRKNTTPRPTDERSACTTEFPGVVHAYTNTHYSSHLPHSIPSTNKCKHSYTKYNTQKHSKKHPTDLFSTNLQYKIKTLFTTSSQNPYSTVSQQLYIRTWYLPLFSINYQSFHFIKYVGMFVPVSVHISSILIFHCTILLFVCMVTMYVYTYSIFYLFSKLLTKLRRLARKRAGGY